MKPAAVIVGLLAIAAPLPSALPWAIPFVVVGVAGLLAAVPGRWSAASTLAVVAATALTALASPGVALATAESLLIFGYLTLLDAAETPARTSWLADRLNAILAAGAALAAVLAALAVARPQGVWLAMVGPVAALAAYIIAIPWVRGGHQDQGIPDRAERVVER